MSKPTVTTKTTKTTGKAKAAAKKEPNRIKVVTPLGRILYPYLVDKDEGRQYSDGKYKCDLLFDAATWKEQAKAMKEAVLKVARVHYADDSLTFKDFKHPFKNGDDKDKPFMEGCMYITAKSEFEPMVVGPDKQVFAADRIRSIKSGDWARCVLSAYPYDQQGGGVTLGLEVVQFLKEGQALAGGRSAALELIDELEVEMEDLDDEGEEEEAEEEEEEAPPPPKKTRAKKAAKAAPVEEEEEAEESSDDDDDILL